MSKTQTTPRPTQEFCLRPGLAQWQSRSLVTSWQVLRGLESCYGTCFSQNTRSNPNPNPNPNPDAKPNPNRVTGSLLHILCQCLKVMKEEPQDRITWQHDSILLAVYEGVTDRNK